MDSLQVIPVEYKLDTFNMPRTDTTLCRPQNWLCQRDAFIPLSTPSYQFTSGPLEWRPTHAFSPIYQMHKNGDSKVHFPPTATWLSLNYSEHKSLHVRRHTLPSQPSQLLITQFRLNTHNLSTSLAAPKANPISMRQIKTIPKNTFRLLPSYFFISPLFTLKT